MKLLQPRLRSAAPRLKVPRIEVTDPHADERATLYGSAKWKRLRATLIADRCAICGSREGLHLDHLVGHGDALARPLQRLLGLPESDWRQRFYSGPFLTLCVSCHSSKSRAELSGRLGWWLDQHRVALGLGHIRWY